MNLARGGFAGAAHLAVDIFFDQREVARAVEAGEMTAMDDTRLQLAQAFHGPQIGRDVRVIALVRQRPVVDRTAGKEDAGRRFPRPIEPGEWPGRCSTSNCRSPRSMMSPALSSRV